MIGDRKTAQDTRVDALVAGGWRGGNDGSRCGMQQQ